MGCEYEVSPQKVTIKQTNYVKSRVEKVPVPQHQDVAEKVSDEVKEKNRSVIGCLSWLAKQTRPDLQFMVAQAQRAQNDPSVEDVKWTNAIVDQAKKFSEEGLVINKIPESQLAVMSYHDAAWANVHLEGELEPNWDGPSKKGSQLAHLTFVADKRCLGEECAPMSMVDWRSKASARVCRSTFAGETLACGDGMESAVYIRALLLSFLHGRLVSSDQAGAYMPIHLFTDCKSLYDHIHKDGVPKLPAEKRLALDLAAIRQELNQETNHQWKTFYGEGEVRPDRPRVPPLHWVPTNHQLADVLTKKMAAAAWWDYVREGKLRVPLKVLGEKKRDTDF